MKNFIITILAAVSVFTNSFAWAAEAKKEEKVAVAVTPKSTKIELTYQQFLNILENTGYANKTEISKISKLVKSKGLKLTNKFFVPEYVNNNIVNDNYSLAKKDNTLNSDMGLAFALKGPNESVDSFYSRLQKEIGQDYRKFALKNKEARSTAEAKAEDGICNGIAKSTCDMARDFAIGTGIFLLLATQLAVLSVASVVTENTCADVKNDLTTEQRRQFYDYMSFDGKKAASAYYVICGQNKNNESVFLSYITGENIDQKILYTRFNRYQKCTQMSKDVAANKSTQVEILAEENRESEQAQKFFHAKAFNGVKTECNPETAAQLQTVIRSLLASKKIDVKDLFALLMRNNLNSDPNWFLPKDSALLKPISVEEFNKLERDQQAAFEKWHKDHPNWKPPVP